MSEEVSRSNKPSTSRLAINMVIGAVFLVCGVVLGLWGQQHSPNISFAERLLHGPDQWVLDSASYYMTMGFAAFLAVGGLLGIIQAFMLQGKNK